MTLLLERELVSKNFTMITLDDCMYCAKAEKLIKERGWALTAHYIENNLWVLKVMKKANLKSFPQIWCEDEYIGGFTDLERWAKHVGN